MISNIAVVADRSYLHEVGEGPDASAVANPISLHDRERMNKGIAHNVCLGVYAGGSLCLDAQAGAALRPGPGPDRFDFIHQFAEQPMAVARNKGRSSLLAETYLWKVVCVFDPDHLSGSDKMLVHTAHRSLENGIYGSSEHRGLTVHCATGADDQVRVVNEVGSVQNSVGNQQAQTLHLFILPALFGATRNQNDESVRIRQNIGEQLVKQRVLKPVICRDQAWRAHGHHHVLQGNASSLREPGTGHKIRQVYVFLQASITVDFPGRSSIPV